MQFSFVCFVIIFIVYKADILCKAQLNRIKNILHLNKFCQ